MKIEPSIRILSWLLRLRKPTESLSLSDIKKRNEESLWNVLAWIFLGPKIPLPKVLDQTISGRHGEIPIRLYYPRIEENLPIIVFFHGGGWVTCNLDTHDRLCRQIAKSTHALILSVDYRLAPWHKYPVPLEDCYDAVVWASSQAKSLGADPNKLMVMGDSCGGSVSATVCLMARDLSGPKIMRQILLYPSVDGTLSYPSHQHYEDAPLLSKTAIQFFRSQYMNSEENLTEPYFSPILANLEHLPPAFVLTAEYDPLHDEAEAYAKKLSTAGNTVIHQEYPGMVHGFLIYPRFCSGATDAVAAIGNDVKEAVGNIPHQTSGFIPSSI